MSEEMTLPESLERLEISPENCYCHLIRSEDGVCSTSTKGQLSTPVKNDSSDQNPEDFLENLSISSFCPKGNCLCNKKRNRKRLVNKKAIRLRFRSAILRAPILRLPGNYGEVATNPEGGRSLATRLLESNISSKLKDEPEVCEVPHQTPLPPSITAKDDQKASKSTCCSVQARLCLDSSNSTAPVSDDTSMDELASYFDIFVHIPKKMSRMAEMMYI